MADKLAALVASLEKLPPFVGMTWRGALGSLVASQQLAGPLPTSRDVRIASSNLETEAVWAVISSAGRDIGPFSMDPAAQEVVILPGSYLTPANELRDLAGLQVQVVLEVRDGIAVGDVPSDDVLVRAIEAARALGPARISQPGRFG
ncbi:hypothetical protein [Pseudolysinimonas sp.]|jgi:hypothetical protein|uniref:hypothetical protein n=1 Tax=Pseudolysinimonas sp. TaxID=2680009 RepID=UPI0037846822